MTIILGYLFSLIHDVFSETDKSCCVSKMNKTPNDIFLTEKLNTAVSSYMSMTLKMQIAHQNVACLSMLNTYMLHSGGCNVMDVSSTSRRHNHVLVENL